MTNTHKTRQNAQNTPQKYLDSRSALIDEWPLGNEPNPRFGGCPDDSRRWSSRSRQTFGETERDDFLDPGIFKRNHRFVRRKSVPIVQISNSPHVAHVGY